MKLKFLLLCLIPLLLLHVFFGEKAANKLMSPLENKFGL